MPTAQTDQARVGLPRRLGAILYDGLICLGLVFGVAIVATALTGPDPGPVARVLLQTALAGTPLAYFQVSWTRGGQTIGMRAWRIRLAAAGTEAVPWDRALLRALTALLSWGAAGLGFLWALADPERLAWHDRLSGTRLVRLPPASKAV